MALNDLLARIDELHARIISAGPLSPEAKRKLDYRFRLDWNYHSNVMEGSSLTKLETRTIMLGNVTVDGKPIKDVLEMKGHDDVITKLLQMSSGELQLSEARIQEVHKAIVKEDDPEKKEWVGHWKPVPNYLTNYRGERIDFTPPADVADAMHRLLDRTKADIERIERKASDAPHPAILAFDFHREYVTIHPFHDGNGRTARIFSNLLLMRFDLPPVIIKVEEKEAYNRLLAEVQVYGASPDLFNAFMVDLLQRSQETVVDAIEGRSIDEPDDVDKELLLFKRTVENNDGPKEVKGAVVMARTFRKSLRPLFQRFQLEMKDFADLFKEMKHHVKIANHNTHYETESCVRAMENAFNAIELRELRSQGKAALLAATSAEFKDLTPEDFNELGLTISYVDFLRAGNNIFSVQSGLRVAFRQYSYCVEPWGIREHNLERLYHEDLSEEEIMTIVKALKKQLLDIIKLRTFSPEQK